jgi:hypothetical protein
MSAALRDRRSPIGSSSRTRRSSGRAAAGTGAILALLVVLAACGTGTSRSGTAAGGESRELKARIVVGAPPPTPTPMSAASFRCIRAITDALTDVVEGGDKHDAVAALRRDYGAHGPEVTAFRDNLEKFTGDAHRYGPNYAAVNVWSALAEVCG